jgi:hypothetical protein
MNTCGKWSRVALPSPRALPLRSPEEDPPATPQAYGALGGPGKPFPVLVASWRPTGPYRASQSFTGGRWGGVPHPGVATR